MKKKGILSAKQEQNMYNEALAYRRIPSGSWIIRACPACGVGTLSIFNGGQRHVGPVLVLQINPPEIVGILMINPVKQSSLVAILRRHILS